MQLYAIIRREGWTGGPELEAAAARSTTVGDNEISDDIRWIRSYFLAEDAGGLGTVCIYEASSPEKIRHGHRPSRSRLTTQPASATMSAAALVRFSSTTHRASTRRASNCVPAQRRSSATAFSSLHAAW